MENQTNTETTTLPDNMADTVENLRNLCKAWEANALATSNNELYSILSATYSIYCACVNDPDLTTGIDELLKHFELKFTKTTSLQLKVVRLVFGTKTTQETYKYRHLAYARVMALAHDNGETAATLAAYIEKKGGIDELRRGTSKRSSGNPDNTMGMVAKSNLSAVPAHEGLATFDLVEDLKPVKGSRYAIGIVRDNQNGTGTIVYGLSDQALIEEVLVAAGKSIMARVEKRAGDDLRAGNIKFTTAAKGLATDVLNSSLKAAVTVNGRQTVSE